MRCMVPQLLFQEVSSNDKQEVEQFHECKEAMNKF
jgi:hypothetical protein